MAYLRIIISAILFLHSFSANLHLHCSLALFPNNLRSNSTKKRTSERATPEGEWRSNPLMVYLQWDFPPLFCSFRSLLTFSFIVVRRLFFKYKIVYLVYKRGFYFVSLSRRDRCTLPPLLCFLGAIVMPYPRSTFGGCWWWAGVCVGLGCRLWLVVIVIPVVNRKVNC